MQAGPIISTAGANTLTISANSTVQGFYSAGSVTAANTFTGTMAGAGTFQKDGSGILAFNYSFNASSLTLLITGGEIDLRSGANIGFGTIHIAGNTILDFDANSATSLTSANLIIDAGVSITVNNWASETDFWYATGAQTTLYGLNGVSHTNAVHNASGSGPLNQITFNGTGFGAASTTWIQTPWGGYQNSEIRPVPEPATYGVIFFSGCLALFGYHRLRRRK